MKDLFSITSSKTLTLRTPVFLIRALLMLILLLNFSTDLCAQSYFFIKENVAFKPLENPKLISRSFDSLDRKVPIRNIVGSQFNVQLFNQTINMDTITVGSPGYCIFQSADGKYNIATDPLVVGIQAYDTGSGIFHGMDITNGVRHYVVEWKNVTLAEYPGKFYNFQLRIQEGSGSIQFHYGTTDIAPGSNSAGILSGIFLLTSANQPVKFKLVAGDPDNPYVDSSSFNASLTMYPSDGIRYSFNTKLSGLSDVGASPLSVMVFPNPASDKLEIQFNKFQKSTSVEILNNLGQLEFHKDYWECNSIELALDLAPGIYLVRINTDDDGSYVQKMLIR